jgi:hypothetical protein
MIKTYLEPKHDWIVERYEDFRYWPTAQLFEKINDEDFELVSCLIASELYDDLIREGSHNSDTKIELKELVLEYIYELKWLKEPIVNEPIVKELES